MTPYEPAFFFSRHSRSLYLRLATSLFVSSPAASCYSQRQNGDVHARIRCALPSTQSFYLQPPFASTQTRCLLPAGAKRQSRTNNFWHSTMLSVFGGLVSQAWGVLKTRPVRLKTSPRYKDTNTKRKRRKECPQFDCCAPFFFFVRRMRTNLH